MMAAPTIVKAAACLALAMLAGAPALAAEPVAAGLVTVTQLPPPPPHEWASLEASINENRVHGNGLVAMPALEKYLNNLYAKVKASAGVPEWPGQVYISSDTTLNAHSSASGNLFLHIALIQSAETEDEIYAVLAHEFAHVYLNHQATYESHNTASNLGAAARLFGMFTGKISGNATGAVKWGLGDTIGAAESLSHDALIPVWQRDVEEQADMAGVYLAMREKYSYPAGFKTFLERLATIEQRESAAQAAVLAALPQGANGAAPAAPRRTHATAQERETLLSERVAPVLPRPRPAPRTAPWKQALREPQTAEILAHFALLPRIAQAHTAGKHGEALQLAKKAASGATENDATMLLTLQNAMQLNGAPPVEQGKLLAKSRESLQPSWNALRQSISLMTLPAQPALGNEAMGTLFTAFGELPAAMPDTIAFYKQTNYNLGLTPLLARCALYASYRNACIDSSKTEQERKDDIAKTKAREEQLGNNAAEKVKKMLKWN